MSVPPTLTFLMSMLYAVIIKDLTTALAKLGIQAMDIHALVNNSPASDQTCLEVI